MPDSVQQFLARLYTDAALRARFLARPYEEARAAGFDEERARELAAIDAKDVELAAESFARKRNLRSGAAYQTDMPFFRTRLGSFVLFIIFAVVMTALEIGSQAALVRLYKVGENPEFSPTLILLFEATTAFAVLAATLVVMAIGRRSWRELGYGVRNGGRLLLGGSILGTAAPMLLIAAIVAFGGFNFGTFAMHGTQLAAYALAWLAAMFALGFAEELTFRGPGFAILGQSIGPWPAALAMTALFVLAHAGKPHENVADLTSVGLLGLFMAFSVIRTGNIWFAVGFHALFDYVALYVLGAPNTANKGGQAIATRLLTGGYHGPAWLTGGVLGIEASWLIFPIIALLFIGFHFATRGSKNRLPTTPAEAEHA